MSDITPGFLTTEYALAHRSQVIGSVVAATGFLTELAGLFPQAHWLSSVAMIAGAVIHIFPTVGYQISRGMVKAMNPGAEVTPIPGSNG